MKTKLFLRVSPEEANRYQNPAQQWEEIIKAFSDSIDDIEEMNKCFALSRYAASVFHALMVVEHGLVRLGQELGVTDPKEGWDASCRRLEQIVKAGRSRNATGVDFVFLEQINVCCQTMKHAWRNKVNHATGKPIVMSGGFARDTTEEIITSTRAFMRRLAEGLPESSRNNVV